MSFGILILLYWLIYVTFQDDFPWVEDQKKAAIWIHYCDWEGNKIVQLYCYYTVYIYISKMIINRWNTYYTYYMYKYRFIKYVLYMRIRSYRIVYAYGTRKRWLCQMMKWMLTSRKKCLIFIAEKLSDKQLLLLLFVWVVVSSSFTNKNILMLLSSGLYVGIVL